MYFKKEKLKKKLIIKSKFILKNLKNKISLKLA
jgi:hypothetical protein